MLDILRRSIEPPRRFEKYSGRLKSLAKPTTQLGCDSTMILSNARPALPLDSVLILRRTFILHTTGSSDVANRTAPTSPNPLFKDSTAVNFSGGNPWKEIGTWNITIP